MEIHCDFEGTCKNKAYKEVYPFMLPGKDGWGWSYLCRKHFAQEQERYKGKLPYGRVEPPEAADLLAKAIDMGGITYGRREELYDRKKGRRRNA